MKKDKRLIKNMTSQQESIIVGMDIVSPVITVPYINSTETNKSKKST